MEARNSLTGVWNGLYSYPAMLEPVAFMATLIDGGLSISGTTIETCEIAPGVMSELLALLSGSRDGSSLSFSKTYDGSGGWSHCVFYDGALSADGSEVEGQWRVPGVMSGKFLMIRNSAKARALTREALEKV